MKRNMVAMLMAASVAGAAAGAMAAEGAVTTTLQTEAQRTDTLSARHGQTLVQTRIASQFSTLAGSDENAQNLVTGLRTGTPITLNTTTGSSGGATVTTTTVIEPQTRPMGYGNVFISLALAQNQLARQGITDPTPQELQAALTGGTITNANGDTVLLEGVLAQRASGMGWGAIAKSQGTSLGHVVSGLKGVNQQVTTQAGTAATSSSAVTAGSGSASTSRPLRGNSGSTVLPPAHGRGGAGAGTSASGIVNAGGQGGASAGVHAGARVQVPSGIVTGAGVGVSSRGSVSPGLGKGHARP
jgi:hypothetical protein